MHYDPEQSLKREQAKTKTYELLNSYKEQHPNCIPIYNLFGDLYQGLFDLIDKYEQCYDPHKKEKLKTELIEIRTALVRLKNNGNGKV